MNLDLFQQPISGPVRCISLWQPWASLMACGAKVIETRHWPTQVRGRVCIHASKTFSGIRDCEFMAVEDQMAMEDALGLRMEQWRTALPFGAIVAAGDLVRCDRTERLIVEHPSQRPFGNFTPGRYGHVYENLRAIGPHACKGAQGFFTAVLS